MHGRPPWAATSLKSDGISPIDGRHLAQVARGGSADIDRAVAGARRAFEKGSWVAQPPAARKKVLLRFAEKLLASREELALLEPEWCPGACDRPEWAVTQVIPLDTVSGIFLNLAATALPDAEAAAPTGEESKLVIILTS